MTPTEKLIRIAAAEVGYIGHGSRSDLDNPAGDGKAKYTKYARDLDAVRYFNGKKQGFDWCAVFVAWCFFKGWGKELSQKMLTYPPRSCGAGVKWVYSYGKRAGRIVKTPKPGDIMILKTADGKGWRHVAIVETVGKDMIHTLEGNSDNRVRRWTYAPNEKSIAGYLRPRWDLADVEPERYTVKKGDSLWKISKRYYGTGWKYAVIAKANGIKGNRILPGQVLIIPDID